MNRRHAGAFWLSLLFLCLPFALAGALTFGAVSLSWRELWSALLQGPGAITSEGLIFWSLRLPRGLGALCAGGVLGVSGVLTQSLTGNPVAEPYVLGLSSGASAGAVAVIIFGLGSLLFGGGPALGAFLGALLSLVLVLTLAGKNPSALRLVLIGMGVGAFFSALTTFSLAQAHNDAQLRTAMYWTLGSLASLSWGDLPLLVGALALSLVPSLFLHRELDLLLAGDEAALTMGLSLGKVKPFVALVAACGVAFVVSKTGVVGFVGLVAPHVARKLGGVRHHLLLPLSALVGALLLLGADTLARVLFRPEELPVGVLTQALGAPLFLWLVRKGYRFGGAS